MISSTSANSTNQLEFSTFSRKFLTILLGVRSSIPPSCLRGDLVKVPELNYSDVIGYDEIKSKLDQVLSFSNNEIREKYQKFGINGSMGGVLLYGPPGRLYNL